MKKGVIAAIVLFALILLAFIITMFVYELKILHESTRAADASESLNVIAETVLEEINKTNTTIKADLAKLVAAIEKFLASL
jgi:hypothetical protein